eukprot:gb/GECG01014095.1/.p1 GENE.gb/GECG01014095.1/~~gb/GECG01014095.1/.p1  ORF type:complete len:854 (+),score=121.29 gb/GECG01014095.1/:1-2562(+)
MDSSTPPHIASVSSYSPSSQQSHQNSLNSGHNRTEKGGFWVLLGDTNSRNSAFNRGSNGHTGSTRSKLYYNKATGDIELVPYTKEEEEEALKESLRNQRTRSFPYDNEEDHEDYRPSQSGKGGISTTNESVHFNEHGYHWVRNRSQDSPLSSSSPNSHSPQSLKRFYKSKHLGGGQGAEDGELNSSIHTESVEEESEDPLQWSREKCEREARKFRDSKFAVKELMEEVFYPFLLGNNADVPPENSLEHLQKQLDVLAVSYLRDQLEVPARTHSDYTWLGFNIGDDLLPCSVDEGPEKEERESMDLSRRKNYDYGKLRQAYQRIGTAWAVDGVHTDPALLTRRSDDSVHSSFDFNSIFVDKSSGYNRNSIISSVSIEDGTQFSSQVRPEEAAATKIQSLFRGKRVRDRLPALQHNAFRKQWYNRAASMVQRVWQQYRALKEYRSLRDTKEHIRRKIDEDKEREAQVMRDRARRLFERRCIEEERERAARYTASIVAQQRQESQQQTLESFERGSTVEEQEEWNRSNRGYIEQGNRDDAPTLEVYGYFGYAGVNAAARKIQKFFRVLRERKHPIVPHNCQQEREVVDWVCSGSADNDLDRGDSYLEDLITHYIFPFQRWVRSTALQKKRCVTLPTSEATTTYHNLRLYKQKQLRLIRSWYRNMKSRLVTLFRMADVEGNGQLSTEDVMALFQQSSVESDLAVDSDVQRDAIEKTGFVEPISQQKFVEGMFALEEEYFFAWLRAMYNDCSLMSLPQYLRKYYPSRPEQNRSETSTTEGREYYVSSIAQQRNFPSSVHQMLYQADLYPRLERTLQDSEHSVGIYEYNSNDDNSHSDISTDSLEGDALADVVRVTSFK